MVCPVHGDGAGKGCPYDVYDLGWRLYRVRCHLGNPAPRGGGLGT